MTEEQKTYISSRNCVEVSLKKHRDRYRDRKQKWFSLVTYVKKMAERPTFGPVDHTK